MAKLKSELEVACPCCDAVLVIDLNLRRVVSHTVPERSDKPELNDATRILEAEAARRESLFEQSIAAEKGESERFCVDRLHEVAVGAGDEDRARLRSGLDRFRLLARRRERGRRRVFSALARGAPESPPVPRPSASFRKFLGQRRPAHASLVVLPRLMSMRLAKGAIAPAHRVSFSIRRGDLAMRPVEQHLLDLPDTLCRNPPVVRAHHAQIDDGVRLDASSEVDVRLEVAERQRPRCRKEWPSPMKPWIA